MLQRSPNYWRDVKVLVTGGTGLLGSWLVEKLLEFNADVVVLVRDWVPRSRFLSNGLNHRATLIRGDVCDQTLLDRVVGEYEIHTIMHLAAQTIVGIANRNPHSTFDTNIRGTWAVLEAARRTTHVKAIVLASSDKAYGPSLTLPYTETTPLEGGHPYDVSKSCADLIAQCYAKTWSTPVAITRCGNFFGGGDLNWNRIVPGTIRSIIRGERPIIRSDGAFLRDYLYVEDAVDAYLLLAEAVAQDPKFSGEAFNFSAGEPRTVVNIVETICAEMESKLEPLILGEGSNEIREQFLDSTKAKLLLGWTAHCGFPEGILRTVKWYRHHFGEQK